MEELVVEVVVMRVKAAAAVTSVIIISGADEIDNSELRRQKGAAVAVAAVETTPA